MTEEQLWWELIVRTVAQWAIAAVFIERGLYQVFDTRLWKRFDLWLDEQFGHVTDPKPWVSAGVCVWLCFSIRFDLFKAVFGYETPLAGTMLLTALAVAGGATGAFKAFDRLRDIRDATAKKKINGSGG
jgi:hypothetical protein